jgi:hypothetical protein
VLLKPANEAVAPQEGLTNDEGVAVFTGVIPGKYTAELTGPSMESTTEVQSASLAAPPAGGQIAAEIRLTHRPASMSGVVFRDDDLDRTVDGSEPAVAGARVRLRVLWAGAWTELGETVTDAGGRYSFPTLRLPEQEVWTELLVDPPMPNVIYLDPGTRVFSLRAGERKELNVRYMGPPESIAFAKRQPLGTLVTVEGAAIVRRGYFGGGDLYIQDETGGIRISIPWQKGETYPGFILGSNLRVTGPLTSVSGELFVPGAIWQSASRYHSMQPRLVTGAQVAARTHEGELALVRGVRVTSIGESWSGSTTDNYDVSVVAPDGTAFVVRMKFGYDPLGGYGMPRQRWVVGRTYDLTGVLTSIDGVPYFRPRGYSDMPDTAPL